MLSLVQFIIEWYLETASLNSKFTKDDFTINYVPPFNDGEILEN